MTEIALIALVSFATATLTLFSGFGLGTLLMPVVALFFPLEIAIAITAIVHLANNLFKIGLLGSDAHKTTLFKFGIPAVLTAMVGALLLSQLSSTDALFSYTWLSHTFQITTVKLVIGLLILSFIVIELAPQLANKQFDKKYLPVGGLLSGFFGGLSGHQGAFRSMFLIKSGLSKQQYVATSAMLAVMVDVARLIIYGGGVLLGTTALNTQTTITQVISTQTSNSLLDAQWLLVTVACLAAFIGSYYGKKLLQKVTIHWIQRVVSVLLVIIALGMVSGAI